jgi:hypothetical protein
MVLYQTSDGDSTELTVFFLETGWRIVVCTMLTCDQINRSAAAESEYVGLAIVTFEAQ